jgi:hypothetical protein
MSDWLVCINCVFTGAIMMLMFLVIQDNIVPFIRHVIFEESDKIETRGRPKGSKNKPKKDIKLHYEIAYDHALSCFKTVRHSVDVLAGIHEPNQEVDTDEHRAKVIEALDTIDYVMKCLKGLCSPSEGLILTYDRLDRLLTELYNKTRDSYKDELEEEIANYWNDIDECMDVFKVVFGFTHKQ